MGIDQAMEIMDRVVLMALRQCQALDDVKAILVAWDVVKGKETKDDGERQGD